MNRLQTVPERNTINSQVKAGASLEGSECRSWFRCVALRRGIKYKNHLGSLPGLDGGPVTELERSMDLRRPQPLRDQAACGCIDGGEDDAPPPFWYTRPTTTSAPFRRHNCCFSARMESDCLPIPREGRGVSGNMNTPDTETCRLQVCLSLRAVFTFVKPPLGSTDTAGLLKPSSPAPAALCPPQQGRLHTASCFSSPRMYPLSVSSHPEPTAINESFVQTLRPAPPHHPGEDRTYPCSGRQRPWWGLMAYGWRQRETHRGGDRGGDVRWDTRGTGGIFRFGERCIHRSPPACVRDDMCPDGAEGPRWVDFVINAINVRLCVVEANRLLQGLKRQSLDVISTVIIIYGWGPTASCIFSHRGGKIKYHCESVSMIFWFN